MSLRIAVKVIRHSACHKFSLIPKLRVANHFHFNILPKNFSIMAYQIEERGSLYAPNYRVYISK